MNEFSVQGGVERTLFEGPDGSPFGAYYELPNGCICCSSRSEAFKMIEVLAGDETLKDKIDCFLIEGNGLADVSKNVKALWADEEVRYPAEITSVVCVVDASRFEALAESESLFWKQLAVADLVVLNKCDLVSEEKAAELEALVKDSFSVEVVRTSMGKIDASVLLKPRFSKNLFFENQEKLQSKTVTKSSVKRLATSETLVFNSSFTFNHDHLEEMIGRLVWETYPGKLIRYKGVFLAKDSTRLELQGYDDVFEVKPSKRGADDDKSICIFIGRDIDREAIDKTLRSALENSAELK